MEKNLLFYSANSYLSHWLSDKFYGGVFYVWCSPVFNPGSLDSLNPLKVIPHSSSPHSIYKTFKDAVESNDNGCIKIRENRAGLKRGALCFYECELITIEEFERINKIIDTAVVTDFKPLLYIIPNGLEQNRLKIVPIEETASILSTEYRIEDLKKGEFDVISF